MASRTSERKRKATLPKTAADMAKGEGRAVAKRKLLFGKTGDRALS